MSNEVRELLALKAICSERKLQENTKFPLGLSESDPGLREGPVRKNEIHGYLLAWLSK